MVADIITFVTSPKHKTPHAIDPKCNPLRKFDQPNSQGSKDL
jgi:hypothetical protein